MNKECEVKPSYKFSLRKSQKQVFEEIEKKLAGAANRWNHMGFIAPYEKKIIDLNDLHAKHGVKMKHYYEK